MKILKNHTVRHLELVLNREEKDCYNHVILDFFERDIYIAVRRSGPNIDGDDYTIIPNEFFIVLDVQEEYAGEFLKHVKKG